MAFGNTAYSEAAFSAEDNNAIAYPQGNVLTGSMGEESNVGDANVNVTGIQATITNSGAVAGSSVLVSVTGSQLTSSIGEEDINVGVPVTGSQLSITNKTSTQDTLTAFGESPFATLSPSTFNIPSVQIETTTGAGQLPSFLLQTSVGDEVVTADANVPVTGSELTLSTNDVTFEITADIDVTGSQANISLGTYSVSADGNVSVIVTEHDIVTSIGSVTTTANADVSVSGVQLTGSVGDLSFSGNAIVELTNFSGPKFSAEGNAALSTDQAKFGVSSLELDGTDDSVDSTTNLDLSSTDFTVDLWIRPDNVTGYKGIWQSGTSTTMQSYLLGNAVYWSVNPSTIITTAVTVNANEWTMLSYERQGNTHRIYKNGTLADTATTANKQDSGPFSIGENGFGDFNGYIDELRVSTVARYTGSSFTEPTSAFTPDALTSVLLHFDGANGSTTITNSAFSGTVVIGKARILPDGSGYEVTIGNITVKIGKTVIISGNQINLATDTVDVISWNPIIPGATGVWIPIDPDNP